MKLPIFRAKPKLPIIPIGGVDAHKPTAAAHLLNVNEAAPDDYFINAAVIVLANFDGVRVVRLIQRAVDLYD